MTHIQEVFVKNLRYYRTNAGLSQLAMSEKINLSPNYLNAVENGKNFPSVEVLQKICDVLDVFPYQLFLENPLFFIGNEESKKIIQITSDLKQRIIAQFDECLEKIAQN